jgi:hypothetical protein
MAAAPELKQYIETETAKGVDKTAITETLYTSGWQIDAIEAAFDELEAQQEAQPVQQTEVTDHQNTDENAPTDEPKKQKKLLTLKVGSESTVQGNDIISILFQLGFASIFLVNGIIALGKPADFEGLLNAFPLAVQFGHIDWMITFAGINDLALGSLILLGKARKLMWVWAGLWLAMVSIIKLIYLF